MINGGTFMEQNFQAHRDNLLMQLMEAHGRVVYSYTAHWKSVDAISQKNKVIKYIQIILSALTAGGFISSIITNEMALTYVSGVCSAILLGITLYYKDFDLSLAITRHSSAANSLWMIREDYISLLSDFPNLSNDEICVRRNTLQKRTAEVYETAPKTDPKSYAATQKALKCEEEQFFSTEELYQLLPVHLREELKAYNQKRGKTTE
jgi:hypothetical protein